MEGIEHRTVKVNGISMHVAEMGSGGPVVLLLHGFPEFWYSWRHQITFLAGQGYRAVAPDLRGYGETDAPASPDSYSILHIVGDVVALIDTLAGEDKVFVVGHDWGAFVGWHLCLFRPERVKALVILSVCYRPRNPAVKPLDGFRALFGDEYYICRFQEYGEAEGAFAQMGIATTMKKILSSRDPNPPTIPKRAVAVLPAVGVGMEALPGWLSEDDFHLFVRAFEKSSFTGGMNYYRNMDRNWELTAPWTGAKIRVPAKFIVGDLDTTYNFPGIKDYIHGGGFKENVPLLEDVVVMEDVAHFLNQEKPHETNALILDFIQKF